MAYYNLNYEMDFILLVALIVIIAIFLTLTYFSLTVPKLIAYGFSGLKNLPRDARSFYYYIIVKYNLFKWKRNDQSVDELFVQTVAQYPHKIAIYYKNEKWSFAHLNDFSNQTANCFSGLGFKSKDEVCLMMNNRPEYMGLWLGLTKIGVIPALINTSNRTDFLLHAIKAIDCKAVIFENVFYERIAEIMPELTQFNPNIRYYCYGDIMEDTVAQTIINCEPIHQMIASVESSKGCLTTNKCHFDSILFYLYTSGTTGFSKAAIFRHYRYLTLGLVIGTSLQLKTSDIIYLSLPLYHANSCVSTCLGLIHGMSVVLKDKFSATDYWSDCIKYKCTVSNYIGELCRYLLAQPIRDCDKSHSIRVMFGNGLRPKIWHDFQQRFNIKLIAEFYASTEGNSNLINFPGREGAVGFYPYYYLWFVRLLYPLTLLKVDEESGEVIRQKNGLCISTEPGEVGEVGARIIDSSPISHFDGYTNQTETKKKIISNVFRKGDKAFLSGDLLRMDSDGFLYFVDRTGDTYRYKGENVSTAEVEAVIQKVTQLSDCVVFGVEVNGLEGKAGMAVIASQDHEINLMQLSVSLRKQLPPYAVPVFVRITDRIESTGSYKLLKNSFIKTGFCPNSTTDCIYFYDNIHTKSYILLDSKLYEDITCGKIRI